MCLCVILRVEEDKNIADLYDKYKFQNFHSRKFSFENFAK